MRQIRASARPHSPLYHVPWSSGQNKGLVIPRLFLTSAARKLVWNQLNKAFLLAVDHIQIQRTIRHTFIGEWLHYYKFLTWRSNLKGFPSCTSSIATYN